MKATDLMIGDYITFAESLNDEKGPIIFKVVALNCPGEGEALMLLKGQVACDVMEIDDEWSGIPITPEILEKNGWVKFQVYYRLRIDDSQYMEYYPHKGRLERIYDHKDGYHEVVFTVHGLNYVHLLQHALRLCGINKEIQI